jgi:hypothetical protein
VQQGRRAAAPFAAGFGRARTGRQADQNDQKTIQLT